jgi:hypothetical protein
MPFIRTCVLGIFLPVLLSACGGTGQNFVAKDEPWRADDERFCLASGVAEGPFVKTRASLGGPSACGALQPFEMAAADGGRVRLQPIALVRCQMIPQVDQWVKFVIEPAARRSYGASLAEVTVLGSYACRPMNNISGAHLSEHGHANALDVSAFILTDGTRIKVKGGWRGDWRQRSFLRTVHDGACNYFTTVLGPDYDGNHHDHFHVDLARRYNGNVCK